jgi:hypothetical protein
MKFRKYTESDYELLNEWWFNWKWPSIPPEALPKNGIVIEADDNEPLCMGFIYSGDACICWLEWVTANPHVERQERKDSLDLLLQELINLSKDLKFASIFTSLNINRSPGLFKKMLNAGFVKTDENVVHLLRSL